MPESSDLCARRRDGESYKKNKKITNAVTSSVLKGIKPRRTTSYK